MERPLPAAGRVRSVSRPRTAPTRDGTLPSVISIAIAGLLIWGVYLARQGILLTYVSALLAIGFSPLVRFIERQQLGIGTHRLPRWLAIFALYVPVLGVLAALSFALLPILIHQSRELLLQLPQLFQQAQWQLMRLGFLTSRMTFDDVLHQTPAHADTVEAVLLTVWNLLGGVFGVATIFILTFYLLVESESLLDAFVKLCPATRRVEIRAACSEVTTKVSAWLTGQLILSVMVGLSSAIGLAVLGIPYSYVLALIAAIGELIPVVGPLLAALPGIALAATVSWQRMLVVTLFYLAQQQIESNYLLPRIMGRQVGLSAAVIIIVLLIGDSLLGILGAMLAIPTAAVLQVIWQRWPADE